uniref:Chromate transporter n=1 Tax=Entomoneis paludosa TaxID=265537 RepID=A0A7S2YB08_9STRA
MAPAEEEKQEEPVVVDADETPDVEQAADKPEDEPTPAAATEEPVAAAEEPAAAGDEDKKKIHMKVSADAPWSERMWEVFTTFWPLGFVAFGGPQAHVAILRDHLVEQRDWLDEEQFTELFAIGQGLPGPTSTQLVISTATSRAGPLGGLMAFFLWNLPGLIVLTCCGVLIDEFVNPDEAPWYLAGLPPAAISLVFKAFYGFASKLDSLQIWMALCSSLVAILINNDANIKPSSSQWVFPCCLALGGLTTYIDSKRANPFSTYTKSPSKGWDRDDDTTFKRIGIPLWVGALIFLVWGGVLALVIILVDVAEVTNVYLEIFETMYRIGSIIFGGGQVVLPMLQDEVVPDWMTKDQFLQGLGLAQSMPGPLFNFASYLGAVYQGVPGALVGFLGLFGPGVILIFAMVPFWARLRHNAAFKAILKGVNATAIGLVGAACVILWESAIVDAADAMVFAVSLTMAIVFSVQAPICIFVGGVIGAILHPDALDLGQVPYCEDQGFIKDPNEDDRLRKLAAFYFTGMM